MWVWTSRYLFSFLFHKQKALEMYINKVLGSSLLNTSCFCFKDGHGVFLFLLLFFHSAICIFFISHIDTTDEFFFPCGSFISEKNGKIPAESAFYKLVDQIGEERMDADCRTKPWEASVRVPGNVGGLPEVGLKRIWFELFKSRCWKLPMPPGVPCMCAHVLFLVSGQQTSCEGLQTYLWYQQYS